MESQLAKCLQKKQQKCICAERNPITKPDYSVLRTTECFHVERLVRSIERLRPLLPESTAATNYRTVTRGNPVKNVQL